MFEKEKSICHYPDAARRFLWNELRGKAADVREAVKKWVVSGKKTTLSVPELTVPDDFWCQSLALSEKSQNKTAKNKGNINGYNFYLFHTIITFPMYSYRREN